VSSLDFWAWVPTRNTAAGGAALLTRVAAASLGEIAADRITRNAADAHTALLTRRDADVAEGAADMSIRNANVRATVETRWADPVATGIRAFNRRRWRR